MKHRIKTGYDPKTNALHLQKIEVEYSQPCDKTSDNWQQLDIDIELIDTLTDFKNRAGI